ncbi:MAG TPA: acyl carrier protein [Steroidobacteraceae bacterium]
MRSDTLMEKLASVLEVDPRSLTNEVVLRKFATWDSLARISLLAVVHEQYGVAVGAEELEKVETVGDISALINDLAAGCGK